MSKVIKLREAFKYPHNYVFGGSPANMTSWIVCCSKCGKIAAKGGNSLVEGQHNGSDSCPLPYPSEVSVAERMPE